MKSLLNYQISEFDCGATCLMNAFNYLFTRKEIPVEFIKMIYCHSLDCFDNKGVIGKYGTSNYALKYLCDAFNDYSLKTSFNLQCELLEKDKVSFKNDLLINCLKNKGIIILKCLIGVAHYVLVTDIIGDDVYFFDPYYRKKSFYDNRIEIVDLPYKANRKMHKDIFEEVRNTHFSLGQKEDRIALLMYNTNLGRKSHE